MLEINSFRGKFNFLSNFYSTPIPFEGLYFNSVESAFQAYKTLDHDERIRFTTLSASQAKREGRKLELRHDWNEVKVKIMKALVSTKFKEPYLKKLLLDTKDLPLIEGNKWGDTFWGKCNGKGRNELGVILMEVRAEFMKDEIAGEASAIFEHKGPFIPETDPNTLYGDIER